MPPSTNTQQRRIEKDADTQFNADMRTLADQVGTLVTRSASRDGALPNTRATRESLSTTIWVQVIKPYFIGDGIEPLTGPEPHSPYTTLIVDHIREAITIQAQRQVAIVEKHCTTPTVLNWLTKTRPAHLREMHPSNSPSLERRGGQGVRLIAEQVDQRTPFYDPFHLFVYGNSPYRLSDRVWRTAIDVRANIDSLLAYHIPRGTAAVDIADLLIPYLTPAERRRQTRKPYGDLGTYSGRRLARTEITAAAGRSALNASLINPYVIGDQWQLSPSHPKIDNCDTNAAGGPNGDGIYPIGQFPSYPDHPHCVTPGQPVQTHRGNIPIENVAAGDLVLTHTGSMHLVRDAWHTPYDGLVYEIKTAEGKFELTSEHPVLSKRGWIKAEDVQLGDEILYAGINIGVDLSIGVPDCDPVNVMQTPISSDIPDRIMPVYPITLNSNLDWNQRKINDINTDRVLRFSHDPPPEQCFLHSHLDRGATGVLLGAGPRAAEVLMGMRFLDNEGLPAILADQCDTMTSMHPGSMSLQSPQPRIVNPFHSRNLAPNGRTPGRVIVAGEIDPLIDCMECLTGDSTPGTIIAGPGHPDPLTDTPHRDTTFGHQVTQHPIGDRQSTADLRGAQGLDDVEIVQQIPDRNASLRLDPNPMPFKYPQSMRFGMVQAGAFQESIANGAGVIKFHDNLSSLPLGDGGGAAPRNAVVTGVANPHQALLHYSTVRAIHVRHYTGPVYNMSVLGDESYTVNGACVHNCLCAIIPIVTSQPAQVTDALLAEIETNTDYAESIEGSFDLTWLIDALLRGRFLHLTPSF